MPDVVQSAAWIWFQDPRAIQADGRIYIGYTRPEGGIWAGQYDVVIGRWNTFKLMDSDNDDHNVASFGVRSDGRIIVAYSPHNGPLYTRLLYNPSDFTSWSPPVPLEADDSTYPNLVYFEPEELWYLFYRRIETGNFRPERFRTSTNGEDWSDETTLFDSGENWPYHKVWCTDGQRIDFFTTTGHPVHLDNNPFDDNAVWHYYYDGTWRNSAGVDIGLPPFDTVDVTQVYDPGNDNCWVWDIGYDGTRPVAVFATFPTTDDHRYQYAVWNGTTWDVREIVDAGENITENANSPHYSGGIVLDHDDPATVYLSRQIGAGAWRIERWDTTDFGVSWSSEQISSQDGVKNQRPFVVPESDPKRVIWFSGRYDDFTDYDTFLQASPALALAASSSESLRASVQELDPIVRGPYRAVYEARVLSRYQTSLDPEGVRIPVVNGDVIYDATAQVFGSLSLTTAGLDEALESMFPRRARDLLSPYGHEIFARAGIDIGSSILWAPLGYFRIDDVEQENTSDAPIQIIAPDRMAGIIDGETTSPFMIKSNRTNGEAAAELVHSIYPSAVIIFDDESVDDPIGRDIVVERSRYSALQDIADSLGKVMYWDGEGVLRIEDAPDDSQILFEMQAGYNGILFQSTRRVSRDSMANGIVARGETAGSGFPVQAIAVDTGTNSPTRWLPPDDPEELWFGQVPEFYDSPLLTNGIKAVKAARNILQRRIGFPYSVDFGTVTNPAVRPRQVTRVTQKDGNREKHIIDNNSIPLSALRHMTGSTREQTYISIGVLNE